MGLKIKWNDDRVRGATTAILLIARDRLARGLTEHLIEASLAEFRADPAGYKINKAAWPEVRATTSLTRAEHIAYYQRLLAEVDKLHQKMEQSRRQFNSLLELDNSLTASLKIVR